VLLLPSCRRKVDTNPASTSDESGKVLGRSAIWKVEIVSAKKERDYTADPLKPRVYFISIEMKIQYLGPSANLKPPVIFLNAHTPTMQKKDNRYGPTGMSFEGTQDTENFRLSTWLFKGQPSPAGQPKE